jgi:hypothetical protein
MAATQNQQPPARLWVQCRLRCMSKALLIQQSGNHPGYGVDCSQDVCPRLPLKINSRPPAYGCSAALDVCLRRC